VRVGLQEPSCHRVADDIGGYHALVHLRVLLEIPREQEEKDVGSLRVSGENKGATVVVVLQVVLECCRGIGGGYPADELVQLGFR